LGLVASIKIASLKLNQSLTNISRFEVRCQLILTHVSENVDKLGSSSIDGKQPRFAGDNSYYFQSHCKRYLWWLALRPLPEPILAVKNDVYIRHCVEVKGWILSDHYVIQDQLAQEERAFYFLSFHIEEKVFVKYLVVRKCNSHYFWMP